MLVKKSMEQLKTTLTVEEKTAWNAYCEEQGSTGAAALRALIKKAISGHLVLDGEAVKSLADIDKSPRDEKITIRLTSKQLNRVRKRVQVEKYPNKTAWVLSCVMASLQKEAVLTDEEVITLRESNRQLMAIGRNLNQIAHALNIDFREKDALSMKFLKALDDRIDAHILNVATLVRKNLNRWR